MDHAGGGDVLAGKLDGSPSLMCGAVLGMFGGIERDAEDVGVIDYVDVVICTAGSVVDVMDGVVNAGEIEKVRDFFVFFVNRHRD